MSGATNILPSWPVQRWRLYYEELLHDVGIDPTSPNTLAQLREIPEPALTRVTFHIYRNDFALYSSCQDELFPMQLPSTDLLTSLPSWLSAVMLGDTHDEGVLWRSVTSKHDFTDIVQTIGRHMSSTRAEKVLHEYNISPTVDQWNLVERLEEMARDAFFNMPNYILARGKSQNSTRVYLYHTDQTSTLENVLKGSAYHAIDLSYVFLNGLDVMSDAQAQLALKMADDFISFTHAIEPYPAFSQSKQCMTYGPHDKWMIKSEGDDNASRSYTRMATIIDAG